MNDIISLIKESGPIAFSLVFALLGCFMIFLHIPKDEKFKYYKYSRWFLGAAFLSTALYCILEPSIPDLASEYTHKSALCLVYLVFLWLVYASFLTLIFTSRYKRKKFLIDGAIPIGLMILLIILGQVFPKLQEINSIGFGIIVLIKSVWMTRTCLLEFSKVQEDLDNYFDEGPQIEWMRVMLWIILSLTLVMVLALYIPILTYLSEPVSMAIYIYLAGKMLNYVPKKIEKVRNKTVESEEDTETAKAAKPDLSIKMEPLVKSWIEKKGYVRPDLSIIEVARDMGTNQNYLSRYLNSHLNMTFSIWLNTLRVEESKKLLATPQNLSIEDIGKLVGFPESYNFSRWFKTVTGETPYQFKKKNQEHS